MRSERHCLACNHVLERDWARANQKFCDSSCQASYWYRIKYKKFYDERYKKEKREWEKSKSGKKAGVKFYQWRKLPKSWR